ncbi:MAG: hypothetical protein HQ559_09200, partial [Lentisphaerae bacterium]|nr:hypothetical protein [Lentisphaerota bacterium]
MAAVSSSFVAGVLRKTGLLTDEQIEAVLEGSQEADASLARVVERRGYAGEAAFLEALAQVLRVSFVRLGASTIEQDVLDCLPTKAVFQY